MPDGKSTLNLVLSCWSSPVSSSTESCSVMWGSSYEGKVRLGYYVRWAGSPAGQAVRCLAHTPPPPRARDLLICFYSFLCNMPPTMLKHCLPIPPPAPLSPAAVSTLAGRPTHLQPRQFSGNGTQPHVRTARGMWWPRVEIWILSSHWSSHYDRSGLK